MPKLQLLIIILKGFSGGVSIIPLQAWGSFGHYSISVHIIGAFCPKDCAPSINFEIKQNVLLRDSHVRSNN